MTEQRSSFFRQEVLVARRMRLDGEVILSRPLGAHIIVTLLACFMVGLAVWVATGRYTRTEIVKGVLATDAETAKIVALRPGIVTRIAITEGQAVRQGQLLAVVHLDQQYAEGDSASQEGLSAIKEQQEIGKRQVIAARLRGRSERNGLTTTIASSRAQHANVQSQIAVQQHLLTSLTIAYERYKPVAAKGFISQTQMDTREQQILAARQQLSQLEQQLISLETSSAEAVAQLDKSRADEETQANDALSSVEGLRAQRSQIKGQQAYVLLAPIDGIVTAVQLGVGRTVDATVPLMTIVPSQARVHVDLYAPSRAMGFVHEGQEVRLLYDSFPYQRFGSFKGTVRAVSRVALDPRQLEVPFKFDEPVYRLSVVPKDQTVIGYGKAVKLQPGMTLAANIILERRTFLEWILDPLNAVMKRDR